MSLYPSVAEFLRSDTYRGDKKPRKIRAYDEWLYIAAFKAYNAVELRGPAKFKIGYTTNFKRRNGELSAGKERVSFKASIVYAWPIPSAEMFETEVKKFFRHFIHKDAYKYMNLGLRIVDTPTEIIWSLKLFTLVKLIRLIILKYTILKGFVGSSDDEFARMQSFLQPPDCIEDNEKRYANMMGSVYSVNLNELVEEAENIVNFYLLHSCNGMGHGGAYVPLTENAFYEYVIPSWQYLKSDIKLYRNIPQGNTASDDENYLGLNIGEDKQFLYQGEVQSCRIIAYGKGPYLGAYIVRWRKNSKEDWTDNYIVEAGEIVTNLLRF